MEDWHQCKFKKYSYCEIKPPKEGARAYPHINYTVKVLTYCLIFPCQLLASSNYIFPLKYMYFSYPLLPESPIYNINKKLTATSTKLCHEM